MELRPEEITKIIRSQIKNYENKMAASETGVVILVVTAVTAVALTAAQQARLTEKLSGITGKTIDLRNRVDPNVLGGVRLDYDGKRLDDTVAHRLNAIHGVLKNTVL